jgi:hypothetical protein
MQAASPSMDRYLSRSIHTVQGFLTELDAKLIATLLRTQAASRTAGHLCEIGVHHGRLFFLLALARQNGERALAIDLFEDDSININTKHAGRDRALLANARRLGVELCDEEIFKTSSLSISAGDILKRTGGPVRFFSVDGSHLYQPVLNDLELAQTTLATQGIIAVDDFFNVDWPEVTFATYDFLRKTDAIVPFAITSSKLYLAMRPIAEQYKATLRDHGDPRQTSELRMLGQDVVSLKQNLAQKAYEAMRRVVGLG